MPIEMPEKPSEEEIETVLETKVSETADDQEKPDGDDKPKGDPDAKASFLDTLFSGQNKPAKEDNEEDNEEDLVTPTSDDLPPSEEKEDEPEEKKEPKNKEPKNEPSDLDGVKNAIAEGMKDVVEAVRPKVEPKVEYKKEAEADPDKDLPEKDRRKIPALQKMEAMNPEKYKGISEKYRENARAQKEYIGKWKAENSGEKFDPDSSDHDDFYKENDVAWDEDDFMDARIELAADRKLSSKSSKEGERLQKLESLERERSMGEEIEVKRVSAMSQTLTGISNDYKDLIKDGKVDNAAIKKFSEEEPEIAEIVISSVNTSDAIAHEAVRLFNGLSSADVSVDAKGNPNNPIHSYIHDSAVEAEKAILAGSSEAKIKNGKTFASSTELSQMTVDQASKHWGVGSDEVISVIASSFAREASEKVKNFEEQLEKFAARRGFEKSKKGKHKNKTVAGSDTSNEDKAREHEAKDPADPTSVETGNEKSVSPDPGKHPENRTSKEIFVDRLLSGQG